MKRCQGRGAFEVVKVEGNGGAVTSRKELSGHSSVRRSTRDFRRPNGIGDGTEKKKQSNSSYKIH